MWERECDLWKTYRIKMQGETETTKTKQTTQVQGEQLKMNKITKEIRCGCCKDIIGNIRHYRKFRKSYCISCARRGYSILSTSRSKIKKRVLDVLWDPKLRFTKAQKQSIDEALYEK